MTHPGKITPNRCNLNGSLASALPAWGDVDESRQPVIGVLVGEGIGAEVIAAACMVLDRMGKKTQGTVDLRFGGKIGLPAKAESGAALSGEATDFCEAVFSDGGAILCGPGGGRFVYDLRAHFDLYCKLTPVRHLAAIDDASIVRPERLDGVDLVIVRENVGGMYFGCSEMLHGEEREAVQRFSYTDTQVQRILRPALELARGRRGRLALALKPDGIPAISALWRDNLEQQASATDVAWQVLEIDNAAYQLIANPREFDVIVAPNMFGDVLSDAASLLLGSRGLSFSGNFGPGRRAVYQTGHGAAYGMAGMNSANPVGQIFSLAMLLRESFGWYREAVAIETAIATVLGQGWRTPDMATTLSRVVGTRELGERIADAAADLLGAP
jgi:3-isopropylmalate dehydrogenase